MKGSTESNKQLNQMQLIGALIQIKVLFSKYAIDMRCNYRIFSGKSQLKVGAGENENEKFPRNAAC